MVDSVFRDQFLKAYCQNCQQPVNSLDCSHAFSQVFQTVFLPSELDASHTICEYCKDLYPVRYHAHHSETCLFRLHETRLLVAGWSTPTSNNALKGLRHSKMYQSPFANLVRLLLSSLSLTEATIVPIPMGDPKSNDRWQRTLQIAVSQLPNFQIIDGLGRNKTTSTRQHVAQKRMKIAEQEYFAKQEIIAGIKGKVIVLFDDNVTTGATMIRCATLLRHHQPSLIITVALERNIHPRLLNHVQRARDLQCDSFIVKKQKE